MTGNVSKISGSFRAEPSRVAAENNRVAAENQRIQNEEERQNAESLRQVRYDSLCSRMEEGIDDINATVSHASDAVQNANSSASRAESAAEGADTAAALANQKAELAHEKASLAQEKADLANEKAALAESKATAADTAAGKANSASESANSAKINADTAAESANSAAAAANAAADRVTEPLQAKNITYDNSYSGLASEDVKTALDELQEKFQTERKRFNPIYCNALFGNAEGVNITVSDAVESTPLALTLYGKCTETLTDSSAEKSPDNPAVITGIGESGSVTVTMCGKNMFDADTLYDRFCKRSIQQGFSTTYFSDNVVFDGRNCVRNNHLGASQGSILFENGMENTQYTFTFYQYVDSAETKGPSYLISYTDGSYSIVSHSKQQAWEKIVITTSAGKTLSKIRQSYNNTPYVTTYWDKNSMMLSVGATEAAYEPYEAQTISVPLSTPLYDLTTSDASTTRQDKITPEGIYIQTNRISLDTINFVGYISPTYADGCTEFFTTDLDSAVNATNAMRQNSKLLITHFGWYKYHANPNKDTDNIWGETVGGNARFRIIVRNSFLNLTDTDTKEEKIAKLQNWLTAQKDAGTPVEMIYGLETVRFESSEKVSRLPAPATDATITNSEGADMSLTYNRDINKALAEINNAIIALGGTI